MMLSKENKTVAGHIFYLKINFRFSSVAQSYLTLWEPVDYSMPGFPVLHYQLKLELVMPSKHLVLWHPVFLLPLTFPRIRVFSNYSALRIMWTKYWSFSISPSNEYSGFISFMINWFDLLAVQGTLKSLLQQHSSKTSVCSAQPFYGPTLTTKCDYWKNHSFN